MPHWSRCGWWPRICTFHCRWFWLELSSTSHPSWSQLPRAVPACPPGSTPTEWDECRGQGTAQAGRPLAGASPGRAGRWCKEELCEEDNGRSLSWWVTKNLHVQHLCSLCWLTVHLHLRVHLAVAVRIGCIADVLPGILPPNVGQCQHSIADCVFPWQRRSELRPGDDRRWGAWKGRREREDDVGNMKSQLLSAHMQDNLPLAWHTNTTVCPSTAVSSLGLTEATGTPGPPSTKISTLTSVIPSLFSAWQI